MKKILTICLINICLIASFFITAEYIIYRKAVSDYKFFNSLASKYMPYPGFFQSYTVPFHSQSAQYYKEDTNLYIRGLSSTRKEGESVPPGILIFGCSFAHGGYFLNNNQTVGYKISQLTGRDVYNFAICGCGIQHMYKIIQNYLSRYIPQNEKPEYAIYIYIPNHIQRLRIKIFPGLLYNGIMLNYKPGLNYPEQEKTWFPFLYKLYTVKKIYKLLDEKRELNTKQDMYDDFAIANELLLASRQELEKKYPGIKFVILRYEIENDDTFREAPFMWDVLKSEGFRIINSSDLIGRKYKYNSEDTTKDHYHPSEEAWDLLVPPLVEELGLNKQN